MRTTLQGDLHHASVPVTVLSESRPGDGPRSRVVVGVVARTPTVDELVLLDDLAADVPHGIERRLATRRTAHVEGAARDVLDAWRPHADAVASLVELAEQSDDPRLQRSAARARVSASRVSVAAARLGRTAQEPTPRPGTADLRCLVERAIDGARQMTGTSSISLDLPGSPLPVRVNPLRLEQGLVRLFVSALHHTLSGRVVAVRLTGGAPSHDARMELSAPAMQVPAAELARLISRFAAAVGVDGERPAGPACLRLLSGSVQATSGIVTGSSSPDSLVFRARWDLVQDTAAHIDLPDSARQ